MLKRLLTSAWLVIGLFSSSAQAQVVAVGAGARTDLDRDGKEDMVVYDRSGADEGTWYILQGGTNRTTAFSVKWGDGFEHSPVLGDFDGDGALDIAVYDIGVLTAADAGTWYILQGGTGFTTAFAVTWGDGLEDIPVPGDYDGDTRLDVAVFDTSGADAGTWYILQGGTSFTTAFSVVWGDVDDRPIPADYDGDTRLDLAVQDRGGEDGGTWYILQGGSNFTTAFSVKWGEADGVPVPGDYDGDGRLDIAVFDGFGADSGTWYILQGGTNFTTAFSVVWGPDGDDLPVPGDWDNDGRLDIAVFDILGADSGTWYILQGGTGFTTAFNVVWGEGGDIALSRRNPLPQFIFSFF